MNAPTLARQNTWLLAMAFMLVEVFLTALLVFFLMLPMARRAADDLAGLMILSAQTWVELPPQTRPAFERELLANHQLALRDTPAGKGRDEWHPPFFYLLEDALGRRLGHPLHLASETTAAGIWYWADLPAGEGFLAVGLPRARIATQPLPALMLAIGGSFMMAIAIAVWLARRVTAPLSRLDEAAARIGHGERPELLPETGPRELAALARRFNAMALQVRDLLSARTTLLAGVSHDLRTPLARMRLALEMLKSNPSAALIARIDNDIEEMNALITTLLDLARGLESETPVDTHLAEMLAELAENYRTFGRSLTIRCPEGIHCTLPRRSLIRAIGNLLQNAIRYAPDGEIELVCENEGEKWRIGVLDRGPGIPAERIATMFEPFQRLDDSRSPQTGGAGLGLAIVRELAKANGWQVRLENRKDGGLAAWIESTRAVI